MNPGDRLRLDDVLFACDDTRGNITAAAERLGVRRQSLHRYLRRTPRAQEAFAEWRERLVDKAEQALWECVEERQPWAVALVLKTVGQRRGYTERPAPIPPSERGEVRLYWPEEQEEIERRVFYLPHKGSRDEDLQPVRERIQESLQHMAERIEQAADVPGQLTTAVPVEDAAADEDTEAEATLAKLADTLQQLVREREQTP
jgi:hypothetical protein